jgi:hypothetical protein
MATELVPVEGGKVLANFLGGGFWEPGVVTKVHTDGTVDIEYDDGDEEEGVAMKHVKAWAPEDDSSDDDEYSASAVHTAVVDGQFDDVDNAAQEIDVQHIAQAPRPPDCTCEYCTQIAAAEAVFEESLISLQMYRRAGDPHKPKGLPDMVMRPHWPGYGPCWFGKELLVAEGAEGATHKEVWLQAIKAFADEIDSRMIWYTFLGRVSWVDVPEQEDVVTHMFPMSYKTGFVGHLVETGLREAAEISSGESAHEGILLEDVLATSPARVLEVLPEWCPVCFDSRWAATECAFTNMLLEVS